MDILQSAQVGLFADSPSRLVPYMNHRGFTTEEISCMSMMAEQEPGSLSDIIISDDNIALLHAAAKLSKVSDVNATLCAALIDDLRGASDMYFGRPHMHSSLFEVKSVKAVKDRHGSLVTKEFVFSEVEGGVALDKYKGSRPSVSIPDNVLYGGDVYPVVEISGWAFDGSPFVTNIVLPYTLVSIGDKAFCDCSELTEIGIPSSVKEISVDAFDGCESLERFDVDVGNCCYVSDSQGILYCRSENKLLLAPAMISGDVVIPDKVLSIEENAFNGCTGIRSVVARGSLESIGSWAFAGCTSLESVTLGNEVKTIGNGAFFRCTSLRRFDVPERVRTIESRVFSDCSSLMEITLPDSLTSIAKWAFELCTSLDTIRIPKSVSKLGQGFYYGCDSLTRIEVDPENIAFFSDEYGMLYDRKRAALIRAPKGISGSVKIREGVTTIIDRAFEGCRDLESITIPESVSLIGKRAFSGCSSIRSLTIPSMVKTIADSTFTGCVLLESVGIPDSVTKIGCGAFSECPSLREVVLPGGRISLGYGAFDDGVNILKR